MSCFWLNKHDDVKKIKNIKKVVEDVYKRQVLDTKVIYPTEPHNKVGESKREVKKLIDKYHVTLISCGNGTASRESEKIIADMIKEMNLNDVDYIITNEAGASVYSASKLATEEFPDFDVAQRSACLLYTSFSCIYQ